MTPPDAVLLDAAGTLIQPREPVEETYSRAARQFGVELNRDRLSGTFIEVLNDMPDLAFDWTSQEDLHCKERDWWRELVRRVVNSCANCIGNFDAFFETLYEHYAHSGAWECYPDVLPSLKALRTKGCRLAVVSNFDSRLPRILEDLGISTLADAVVYSSAAGSAKPDPAIFSIALTAIGVVAERAIHVGDSPDADVEGAARAGIGALLIQRGKSPTDRSNAVIESLGELLERFDSGNPLPL